MHIVLEYGDPQIQSHTFTGGKRELMSFPKATQDLLLWCSALDSQARALYDHKLLTIGDLTHLLRWNYGVDLELENVCLEADKDIGIKEKKGYQDGERGKCPYRRRPGRDRNT